MKKAFAILLIILVLMPTISLGATPQELENQRIQLLQQLVVLLQARVQFLLAELGQSPAVLGASISKNSSSSTPAVIKKKKSGGGGGGGGSSKPSTVVPAPLTLDMDGMGNNFTVIANYPLDPQKIAITLLGLPDGVTIPSELSLVAKVSDGSEMEISLVKESSGLIYSADMRARLSSGLSFPGDFELVFPADLSSEKISYTVFYEGNGVTRTINLENAGDTELFILDSADSPDATTIGVDGDEISDSTSVFAFDISNVGGANSIVEGLTIGFQSDPQLVGANIFSSATLSVGGNSYLGVINDDDIYFDLSEIVEGNTTDQFALEIQFKAQNGNYESGQLVSFSFLSEGLIGIREDNGEQVSIQGSVSGDTHVLQTSGAILELNSVTETLKENNDGITTDDEGVFAIEFDVTAFESDLWINKTAVSGTTMGTAGVNFTVEDGNGNPVVTGTTTAALSSTADIDGTRFLVSEGETETFTLTVEYDPITEGFYDLQLYSLNFATSNENPTDQQLALPSSDFESDFLSI